MFGLTLMLILTIMGGIIAFLGDKIGSKIGKKRLSIFGLRPYHTSVLMTIVTGVLIAVVTLGILAAASKDAQTALFGMDKLRSEITALNNDKDVAQVVLLDKNKLIESLDGQIKTTTAEMSKLEAERDAISEELAAMEAKYAAADADLGAMRGEVAKLEAARADLNKEIKGLEEETRNLREGLIAVREGDLVFRASEVIFSGVLKGGLPAEDNTKQMDAFLATANQAALERLGIKNEMQIIWLPEKMVEDMKARLAGASGTYFVRVCAAGNIVAGEMAVSYLEIMPNSVVYESGQKIYSKKIDLTEEGHNINAVLLSFLSEVNRASVAAGVVPDTLTGRVGNIDAATMIDISEKMMAYGGEVVLTAYAKQDIEVSGPVLLRLEVQHYGY